MSYQAAINHLNALIPELFTAPGSERRKFSLREIGLLCRALGDPQRRLRSVLIAGTNGKGSTAATLASIAAEAGLRVGLYTSPHLDRVNERIRLNDPRRLNDPLGQRRLAPISDEDFGRHYFAVQQAAEGLISAGELPHLPSFFELLTAVAFRCFAEAEVDLAVLEVGMGGRLDATNIVTPLVSVITDIALDHQEWLGATIAAIAREKAGILRQDGVLVTLPQHPEANQAIGEVATELGVRGVNAAEYMPPRDTDGHAPYALEVMGEPIVVDSPLHGAHQHRNVALAIATAVELASRHGFGITAAAIAEGIRATEWPGRLEELRPPNGPTFLLDVAHNPAGAWALRAALQRDEVPEARQVLVFGCLRDKPLAEMTQILFPLFDAVVLAPIHSPRAAAVSDLSAAAAATGTPAHTAATVAEALELAAALVGADSGSSSSGRVVVSGSVYLVGEARHLLLAASARGGA